MRFAAAGRRWVALGAHVGDFQARFVLTLFYWLVAAPFAVAARCLDPLRLRPRASSGWVRRGRTAAGSLEAARRQY